MRGPLLLLVFFALLLVGCVERPVGTHDAELSYRTADLAKVDDTARDIRLRLQRTSLTAEVAVHDDAIRVTLDEDHALSASVTLGRRGGLSIYRFEPGTQKLAQEPLFDLAGIFIIPREKTLWLLPPSKLGIKAKGDELGDEPVAFTRGRHVLFTGPLKEHVRDKGDSSFIDVPLGDDIGAWSRAKREARWLNGPVLPPLGKPAVHPVPTRWLTAIASVAVPILGGILWLVFVRRFDRARPEPRWLVLATFGLGMVSASLAGFVEHELAELSVYLDPSVMAFDGTPMFFPITLFAYVFIVGFVEEGAKLLAAWSLAMHRREFDEPIDGILFAAAASIGFAVAENFLYFTSYRLGPGVVTSRTLMCIPDHMMYGAIWGAAFGKRLVSPKKKVWPWFLLAAFLHALTDTLLTYDVPYGKLVMAMITTGMFVFFVRKALRWSAVEPGRDEAPPSARREHFRVGSAGLFGVSVIGLFGCTATLVWIAYGSSEPTPLTASTWISSSVGVVLVGLAAWGLTRSIPLDVALDERGVTFAGALCRWDAIREVSRTRGAVVIVADADDMRLGPAADATLDLLEHAIRAKITAG